jgi:pyruvate,orthophosphate dikinase
MGGAVTDPAPISLTFAEAAALDEPHRAELLGGKGAGLVRMTELGLPVPPGFVLTTSACRIALDQGWSAALDRELADGISWIEQQLDRRLGDPETPLLVSVRSGAPVSMPGMLDTVLNVGSTEAVADALSQRSGGGSFGWDTARRFVQSYAAVVAGAPAELVDGLSARCLGPGDGLHLSPVDLSAATRRLRGELAAAGYVVPDDPTVQIRQAARAVFASWNSDRAKVYRRVEGIAEDLGTAVTVQAMIFGNLGERSGTGVAFSRDPSTGGRTLVGEFLPAAQGEDVVSGTHTTRSLSEMRALWPETAGELAEAAIVLERDLGDIADIEFTVEDGVLWLLQVRVGKRSPRAALRAAIDMADDPEFPLDRAGALARVNAILADPPTAPAPESPAAGEEVLADGLAASPGRAVGVVCTDVDEALDRAARGEPVVLIRRETSPADVAGMAEAAGLVTTLGGIVSHAAVVARSWGIPAVVGAAAIEVSAGGIVVGGRLVSAGETVTVDGDRGLLLRGGHPGSRIELEEVRVLTAWSAALQQPTGPRTPPEAEEGFEVDLAEVRRIIGLRGMASADSLVDVLGCGPGQAAAALAAVVDEGSARELPGGRVRLTGDALASVDELFRRDSSRLRAVVEPLMDDFHAVNGAFKELVTAWQMRVVDGTEVVNDHTDEAYDAGIVMRLRDDIHPRILAIVEQVAGAEPRLARYTERLAAALEAVQQGDAQMMAHPLRDSYHTVWFELHEELIRLCGRDRASEAAAGRA